jgi:RNA polymerase sigma factor (sigma-70 family)
MDAWVRELQRGSSEAAWDAFLDRYRRLIFAAIRHYAQDYDDVMDVFARVCESLRADDLRRLRSWTDQTEHRASFSTWLVTVVRNLTIDWFRGRDGRHRVSAVAGETGAFIDAFIPSSEAHITAARIIEFKSSITMCHRPPGNPQNEKNISVGYLTAGDHVRHGDLVGPCP